MFDLLKHIKSYNFMNYPTLAYLYLWYESHSEPYFVLLSLAVVLGVIGNLFVIYSTRNLVQDYHRGKIKNKDLNLVSISKWTFNLESKGSWTMVLIYLVTFVFYLISWIYVGNQMAYPYGHRVFLIGLGVLMSSIFPQIFYIKEARKLYRWVSSFIRNKNYRPTKKMI